MIVTSVTVCQPIKVSLIDANLRMAEEPEASAYASEAGEIKLMSDESMHT